jgi:hypothetical protein
MTGAPDSFDLDAAWMRRAQSDLRGFMDALAVRMESALPGRVDVERKRDGLLSKTTHVRAIAIDGDGARYTLVFDKGRLQARRAKIVRGVVIGTAELPIEQWLTEVRGGVEGLAGSLGGASDIIKDFL